LCFKCSQRTRLSDVLERFSSKLLTSYWLYKKNERVNLSAFTYFINPMQLTNFFAIIVLIASLAILNVKAECECVSYYCSSGFTSTGTATLFNHSQILVVVGLDSSVALVAAAEATVAVC
jgi:hypothetical protein